MATLIGIQFEHYHAANTLGVQDVQPRLSWRICDSLGSFKQSGFEAELLGCGTASQKSPISSVKCTSSLSNLVPWPFDKPLYSRQIVTVRVRAWDAFGHVTPWCESSVLETGLLQRTNWQCDRIAAPWAPSTPGPSPEQLFRKEFLLEEPVQHARLYITAQGLYEAEINGQRVGDYFLAPGWTAYDNRLQYQTYDVTSALSGTKNCLGVRVAEGWFSGRLGWAGGLRNIWGTHSALLAQLEITLTTGRVTTIMSDASWTVCEGPIRLAEIYDGEKYDATQEMEFWSSPSMEQALGKWEAALLLPPLPASTELTAGFGEPVRRIEVVKPVDKIQTPSGRIVIDFGQNLVGYMRMKGIKGSRGHKITLRHAEVLENGELGTRPLRICEATDEYTLKGSSDEETYEPRFTFHGFRYAQVDGWPGDFADFNLAHFEAVVCHTDMKSAGMFSCSDPLLNQLYKNIRWGMRGNFFSVPTDCPQRDERFGYSGDLALFAPTATLIYDCFGILKNWLLDVEYDQTVLDGVPPMVSPNATLPDPVWCRRLPCAIWHDVTVLAPWALYQETGDKTILAQQYDSMLTWMNVIPRGKEGMSHLWDVSVYQLGDWLDPAAPPTEPWRASTDPKMVANMYLIQSLDLVARISAILGKEAERASFEAEARLARTQFQREYVTPNGRMTSDTQAGYAVAICFDLLEPLQRIRAGLRLAELVRKNGFRIGTGFASTPFVCEALARTGYLQVAYSMLLEKTCPSWLYPVTMGATTVWERWDSMLPDGSINPGEMTSFNHYAFGAIAKFLYERIAGLQQLDPGWTKFRVAPSIGATFSQASATHITPYGAASCSWETSPIAGGRQNFDLKVSAPYGTTAEIILPDGEGNRTETVGAGNWSFKTTFKRDYEWPVLPLKAKS